MEAPSGSHQLALGQAFWALLWNVPGPINRTRESSLTIAKSPEEMRTLIHL